MIIRKKERLQLAFNSNQHDISPSKTNKQSHIKKTP